MKSPESRIYTARDISLNLVKDPQEVFESLPAEWQECFEKRDIPMLQEVVAS